MPGAYLADYKLGWIAKPTISLSQAVAASSAFPPVLSPQCIKVPDDAWQPSPGASITDPTFKSELILTDGGVYDNMGLEAIWHRWSTVLVSDAGAPLWPSSDPPADWARQLAQVLDVVTDQTRALRKRW